MQEPSQDTSLCWLGVLSVLLRIDKDTYFHQTQNLIIMEKLMIIRGLDMQLYSLRFYAVIIVTRMYTIGPEKTL